MGRSLDVELSLGDGGDGPLHARDVHQILILFPQGGSLAAVIRSPTPLDPSPRSQYFSTAGSFNGEGGDRAPRTVPQPQRLCYFWTGDMSEL